MVFVLVASGCLKKPLPSTAVLIEVPSAGIGEVTPVLASVIAAPAPAAMSDGTICLNYELMVTDVSSVAWTIESLEILNPDRGDLRLSLFSQEDIQSHLHLPGAAEPTATLGPAQSGYVRINLSFKNASEIPSILDHVLTVTTKTPKHHLLPRMVERVARTSVDSSPALVIGPPVKGSRWVAVAVGGDSYHRRTVMPLNGRWVAAERWAVDWIQIDEQNRLASGDPSANESYPQYGREIVAVADGTVLSTSDGMADGAPGKMPENITIDTAGGNYVLQDIGGGHSAFYAHLIPGSLRVAPGDHVRRGQVLGLLGNSGNSDAPHLHFHIVKGKTALASNGVPYVIDSFELKGQVESQDYLDTELKNGGSPVDYRPAKKAGRHHHEMPANLSVVEFVAD